MVTSHLPWKFHANRSSLFLIMLLTKKQTKKEIAWLQYPVPLPGNNVINGNDPSRPQTLHYTTFRNISVSFWILKFRSDCSERQSVFDEVMRFDGFLFLERLVCCCLALYYRDVSAALAPAALRKYWPPVKDLAYVAYECKTSLKHPAPSTLYGCIIPVCVSGLVVVRVSDS